MKKLSIIMERLDAKETPGCIRYGRVGGDAGLETLYLRKTEVGERGSAPARIHVVVEPSDQ